MDLPLAQMQENAGRASTLLRCMANESRLLILCNLVEGEKTVGELEEKLQLSQSALSQHLAVLRREKLVATRRQAQFIHYSLASEDVRAVLTVLYERFCAPDANPPE